MTAADPTIPGLEPPTPAAGRLERAVHGAVSLLEVPTALDLARAELCLELARVMDSKLATRRTSTYSNDARLLAELLGFTGDAAAAAGDVDAQLRQAIEEWNALERPRP